MLLASLLASWKPEPIPSGPTPPPMPGPHGMFHGPELPDWLDSAASGRTRRPWSGLVELELPQGRRDTARVCGGPDGFRLDFRNGRSHWAHGDTLVFLDASGRTARMNLRPPMPPELRRHAAPTPIVLGADTCLGRRTLVFAQRGPRGGARRLWVDTTLPLLLRGEGPGPGARRVLALDLSHGCAADAFTIPPGWKLDVHEPRAPHEEASVAALASKVRFRVPQPSWLPPGFEPAGQSWMDGRKRRVAHVRWSDGARIISLFATGGPKGFKDCDGDGPCQQDGPEAAAVRRFDDVSVLVTGPLPPEEIQRIVNSLR